MINKDYYITNKSEGHILSIIKGIGILLVVMGHCMSPFTPLIYMFHMSLFFFASGYFFKDKHIKTPFKFAISRFKGIYIKYINYCLIFILFRNVFLSLKVYDTSQVEIIKDLPQILLNINRVLKFEYGEPFLGAVWFLKVLFYINIVFIISSIIAEKISENINYEKSFEKVRFLLILSAFTLGFYLLSRQILITNLLPNSRIFNNFIIKSIFDTRVLVCIVIYYIGYLFRINKEKIKIRIDIALVCIVILKIQGWYGNINVDRSEFISPSFFIVSSLSGIYIIITISKLIDSITNNKINNKIKKILIYSGNNSLMIMIYHILAFKIVSLAQIMIYKLPIDILSYYPAYNHNKYWWIVNLLCGFFVPLVSKSILDKYKEKIQNNR